MQNKKYMYIGIIVIIIVLVLFFAFLKKSKNTDNEVVIGYSALRISLPVFIAQENGFFKEEGLNVRLQRFDTAQPLMSSLVAGTIDVGGYTALPITLSSMLRGKTDLYFVTSMIEDQSHRISSIIIPEKSPENFTYKDLSGKKIGILPTIAYKVWIEQILKKYNVDLKTVEIVQIDPALQGSALANGQVNALFTNDPVATTVIQKRIGKLISNSVELPEIFGDPFIFGSFNIRKDFADKNPEITKKIVSALNKSVEYVNNNPKESKEIMKSYMAEAQKPFTEFYPNALYQSTEVVIPEDFQKITDAYYSMGIIDSKINVIDKIISKKNSK